jgi:hypothetical protein
MLTFDEMEDDHDQQTSSYPRVEDTSSLDRRPDIDATMENVAEISGVAASGDHVDIELALRKANLEGCKDALPSLRSFEDDEDDGGHEKQFDVRLPSHLYITWVVSGQASSGLDSIHPEHSGQGGQDLHAEEEGNMLLDAVDYEMDVYEAAMCDPSDGGADAFFLLEHSSIAASGSRDKVRPFFFSSTMLKWDLSHVVCFSSPTFVPYISFPYMYHFDDRYSSSLEVGTVDVPASSSLRVLVSQEFYHRSIGLLYLKGNSPLVIYFSHFQNQNTVVLDNLSVFCSVRNVMSAQRT